MNHVSSATVLGDEYPVHAVCSPAPPVLYMLSLKAPVLAVSLLFPQSLAVPPPPLSAGTINPKETSFRSVVLPAPGQETSRPAGGCFLPSCHGFRFLHHLPPGNFWLTLEPLYLVSLSIFNLQLWCEVFHR